MKTVKDLKEILDKLDDNKGLEYLIIDEDGYLQAVSMGSKNIKTSISLLKGFQTKLD